MFLFVILFGLDGLTTVFILTRVRELYDLGMSTDDAVREDLRHGWAPSPARRSSWSACSACSPPSFIDFKEMGVGLAFAILIDATIIPGRAAPRDDKLLGDWNWYLPHWLDRLLPGSAAAAAPSTTTSPRRLARRLSRSAPAPKDSESAASAPRAPRLSLPRGASCSAS